MLWIVRVLSNRLELTTQVSNNSRPFLIIISKSNIVQLNENNTLKNRFRIREPNCPTVSNHNFLLYCIEDDKVDSITTKIYNIETDGQRLSFILIKFDGLFTLFFL